MKNAAALLLPVGQTSDYELGREREPSLSSGLQWPGMEFPHCFARLEEEHKMDLGSNTTDSLWPSSSFHWSLCSRHLKTFSKIVPAPSLFTYVLTSIFSVAPKFTLQSFSYLRRVCFSHQYESSRRTSGFTFYLSYSPLYPQYLEEHLAHSW